MKYRSQVTFFSSRSLVLHRCADAASFVMGSPGISTPHSWVSSSTKCPASRLASTYDFRTTHLPAATAARYFSFLDEMSSSQNDEHSHMAQHEVVLCTYQNQKWNHCQESYRLFVDFMQSLAETYLADRLVFYDGTTPAIAINDFTITDQFLALWLVNCYRQ